MKINQVDRQVPPKQVRMMPEVFAQICDTIGTLHAEQGGILGGCRKDRVVEVTHFYFDETACERSGVAYTPNNTFLNNIIKAQWRPQGIDYLGSIHSHPAHCTRPSDGDETYAKRILEVLELPYLLVPIVTTIADTGTFQLHPYAAVHNGDSLAIIEQELCVGGKIITNETHASVPVSEPVSIPWETLVIIGGAGLFTVGIAIAQMLRYYQKLHGGEY